MSNYYWRQPNIANERIDVIKGEDDIKWLERYPKWVYGYKQWRNYWEGISTNDFREPFKIDFSELTRSPPEIKPPCVFISHRQSDETEAVYIANLASTAGFNYWLDVFDPNLKSLEQLINQQKLSKAQECFAIASIIEMGLVNCSHVLVVYTRNTKGSNWIPYEYGRVKNSPVITVQAASWVERSININSGKRFPEYMHLGKIIQHRNDINDRNNPYYYLEKWFKDELGKWNNHP